MKSNCEECKLKNECSPMYPCELNNKWEEARAEADRYKAAWSKLRTFVEALQDGFENYHAYSSPHLEDVENEMNLLEEELLKI